MKPADLDKFDAVLDNNERVDPSLVAYKSQLRTTLDDGQVLYFCNSCKSALRSTSRLKTRLDSLNRLACRSSNTNDTAHVRDADHKYCPHRAGDNYYCSAYRSLVNADKEGRT